MEEYSKAAVETFLAKQGKLFDEPVAETEAEAAEFLEEIMAVQVSSIEEVRQYLDEAGMDVTGLTDGELAEEAEVFAVPDGSWLIVEG